MEIEVKGGRFIGMIPPEPIPEEKPEKPEEPKARGRKPKQEK